MQCTKSKINGNALQYILDYLNFVKKFAIKKEKVNFSYCVYTKFVKNNISCNKNKISMGSPILTKVHILNYLI